MLILNRFLDVDEYSFASIVGTKKASPIKSRARGLRVNLIRLATAIAKTMYCSRASRVELPFMVAEQISALQRHTSSFALDGNLRLTDRHFGKLGLRDFSKTTIEGQYAQGLCFLFAQDVLEIPALIDFDLFCSDFGITALGSNFSKPDFVACQNPHGYWLVESKGSLESDSIKTALRKGIKQCDSGATHLISQGLAALRNRTQHSRPFVLEAHRTRLDFITSTPNFQTTGVLSMHCYSCAATTKEFLSH